MLCSIAEKKTETSQPLLFFHFTQKRMEFSSLSRPSVFPFSPVSFRGEVEFVGGIEEKQKRLVRLDPATILTARDTGKHLISMEAYSGAWDRYGSTRNSHVYVLVYIFSKFFYLITREGYGMSMLILGVDDQERTN